MSQGQGDCLKTVSEWALGSDGGGECYSTTTEAQKHAVGHEQDRMVAKALGRLRRITKLRSASNLSLSRSENDSPLPRRTTLSKLPEGQPADAPADEDGDGSAKETALAPCGSVPSPSCAQAVSDIPVITDGDSGNLSGICHFLKHLDEKLSALDEKLSSI